MPSHVHLVMVPATVNGLRTTPGESHQRYTRYINFREGDEGIYSKNVFIYSRRTKIVCWLLYVTWKGILWLRSCVNSREAGSGPVHVLLEVDPDFWTGGLGVIFPFIKLPLAI